MNIIIGADITHFRPPMFPRRRTMEESGSISTPKSGRILVVDDNVDAADTLGALFRALGYETNVAYNGSGAFELYKTTHPRFAFLDIAMPDMSGYELAAMVRNTPADHRTTLVALTGFGQADDRQRAVESGFDHYLTKPVGLAELRNILDGPR